MKSRFEKLAEEHYKRLTRDGERKHEHIIVSLSGSNVAVGFDVNTSHGTMLLDEIRDATGRYRAADMLNTNDPDDRFSKLISLTSYVDFKKHIQHALGARPDLIKRTEAEICKLEDLMKVTIQNLKSVYEK